MDSAAMMHEDFDLRTFRLNAVKKAAAKFGGRCHVRVELVTDDRVRITLQPKQALAESADWLIGELRNEVLDQELRELVAEETAPIRDVLLAQAFSRTSLLQPLADEADWRDDPLGARGDR